ncbi:MAG: hypothetical protein HPY59_06375 [Anaerolineae bacterium]|nr:hypothetical protein [Anaerolineae bacterium]
MTKLSTRDNILNYLSRHNYSSAEDISLALNTSTQNIRYHLGKLIIARIVQVVPETGLSQRTKGRKKILFFLSTQAYQNNYATIASALLKILKELPHTEPFELLLRSVAQEMFLINANCSSPVERLNQAVQRLNDQHYHAHWEARFNGPTFIFHNCPYAALLPLHPEFCNLDCLILEHLVGIPYQIQSRIFDHKTPAACLLSPAKTIAG